MTKNAPRCPVPRRKPSPLADTASAPVAPPASSCATVRGMAGRSVTFRATIPPIETAIKVHGEGGARMMLDIAESDLAGFLPALAMRGMVLAVTLREG